MMISEDLNVSAEQVYTSIACNRTSEIVDWNNDGLICFGGSNAVFIYNPKEKRKDPITVLTYHSQPVNSVKWIHNGEKSTELISCSADKTAAIWSLQKGQWNLTSSLKGHNDGVTCVHGIYWNDNLIVYTASIDATIKVWERHDGITNLKHTIDLHYGLCLTLHAHVLPIAKKPVLFCALDDHKIHMFTGEDYQRVHALTGHEDWVRGLDVLDVDDSTILLASGSQDANIRLWRIQPHTDKPTTAINVEEKEFQAHGIVWSAKLDAVLSGHEAWVYGVQWHPYIYDGQSKKPVYKLISSSLDKSLIIWEPESSTKGEGVWVEKVRVGDVGGSGLGFYGSRFGPDGAAFLGHGYCGTFHIWNYCKETDEWSPRPGPGGHLREVLDLSWEPRLGRYLLSSSADQTTRIHAPFTASHGDKQWHEIARPQIHGYDMSSVAAVTSTTFACAAEEKVVRVFRAPNNFISNFMNIVGEMIETNDSSPQGAAVPSLGLSNKAVFAGDDSVKPLEESDGYFVPVDMKEPPTEETLMQNTLWPEAHKLYAHGYEVHALAASPDGLLLASACRATTPEHAAPVLWDTSSWQMIQKLLSHSLTVTQMSFAPDSQRLVSVSRDRCWALHGRNTPGARSFVLLASSDKTNGVHTRIIWCCAWATDGSLFGTGSRDGKVCLWHKLETSPSDMHGYALRGTALSLADCSVTAIAFPPIPKLYILALGLSSGHIRIYSYRDTWTMLYTMDNNAAHHLPVRKLVFKPKREDNMQEVLLASAGDDHLVRIHRLTIN